MKIRLHYLYILPLILLLSTFSYGQSSLFPQITGWNLTVEEKVYDANNLWDLIDGAADLYLEYAFVELRFARYLNADRTEVKAEIYKHGSLLDAFGMYSQERDPGYHYVNAGAQGYLEEGVLNFLDGNYYIKLSTLQKGETAQKALLMIAQKLNENLKQDDSLPAELSLFPADKKQINTEKYISQNFMGHSFLKSVLTANYEGKTPFTAFIINAGTHENAVKALKDFVAAENKEGAVQSDAEKYFVKDSQDRLVEISVIKNLLYGTIGLNEKETRNEFLEKMKSKLQ